MNHAPKLRNGKIEGYFKIADTKASRRKKKTKKRNAKAIVC